ncbi:3-oxoacyl-reductase [Mollisia scopiformis]|uniref:3-oxoacyl-reductase n=1 Tax=Mollisia scopiformis TaxID=149040 RepID=A0A194X7B0_MOLSC|nr:3-oxoacyl-reductase [Mollisia scopiformis]KUJ16065.1 3-oxoacyl-reductase [Mollisia scopiformis]
MAYFGRFVQDRRIRPPWLSHVNLHYYSSIHYCHFSMVILLIDRNPPTTRTCLVWFITGSSRGLGLALTEAALETGASVIATARNPASLDHLVQKYGAKIYPLPLNVTMNDQVLAAVKRGHEHFGHIDVIVNNAGYADLASVEDTTIESFREQFETNYLGVVYVTKAVLPILRAQGSGHIINVSSVGGRMGTPGLSAYQSAKWAVGGFSTVLAQEVGALGIKVTVLEPGGMNTDWAGSSMSTPPISEPYKQSVGAFAEILRKYAGQAPSSLQKIASVVVKLSGMEEVPLRLMVGSDAVHFGGQAGEALKAEDEKWKDLSLSVAEQEFTGLPGVAKD